MAKLIFIGAAQAVSQVNTITQTGTYSAGDTITIKVNARFITYTCVTGDTLATITAALLALCQAATAPEFKEITWTSTASTVITATSTAGVPVTITTSDTGASGTSTLASVQTATGPWHWDNVLNWSTGAVPTSSDEVYVDDPNQVIAYGLPTSLTLVKLHVRTGRIGLPDRNPAGYMEYRPTRAGITCTNVLIGNQDAKGPSLCRLDLLVAASVVVVYGSGTGNGYAAVDLVCNNSSASVSVITGQVAIADGGDETSTVGTVRCGKGAALTIGPGVTVTTVDTSGNTILSANVTNLNVNDGSTTLVGTATVTTLTVTGGSCVHKSSGTITTANIGPGTLDCSQDPRTRTITNSTLNKGGAIDDAYNAITFTNKTAKGADADRLMAV